MLLFEDLHDMYEWMCVDTYVCTSVCVCVQVCKYVQEGMDEWSVKGGGWNIIYGCVCNVCMSVCLFCMCAVMNVCMLV